MKLLERYIFRRVFLLFLGTLMVTTAIAMITQVLIHVNLMSSTGQSLMTFLRLAGLLIPAMLVVVAPFALMLGTAQTLTAMNADSELPVIEAAGGSRSITGKPVLVLAVLLAIATLATSIFVEPWTNRNLRDLLVEARTDLISVAVQSGTFHEMQKDLYVQVSDKLSGGVLGGIFLADQRDSETELIYYAKYGTFIESEGKDFLVMTEGELHQKENKSGNVSVISFATYAFDLSLVGGESKAANVYYAKEHPTSYLLNPDPNDKSFQRRPQNYVSELLRRLSEWLYPILFALITIYFLGRAHSHRSEQVWNVVFSALTGFLMRGFGYYFTDKSGKTDIGNLLVFVVPVGGILLFSILILTNTKVRLPRFLVYGPGNLLSFFNRLRLRRSGMPSRLDTAGKRGTS